MTDYTLHQLLRLLFLVDFLFLAVPKYQRPFFLFFLKQKSQTLCCPKPVSVLAVFGLKLDCNEIQGFDCLSVHTMFIQVRISGRSLSEFISSSVSYHGIKATLRHSPQKPDWVIRNLRVPFLTLDFKVPGGRGPLFCFSLQGLFTKPLVLFGDAYLF